MSLLCSTLFSAPNITACEISSTLQTSKNPVGHDLKEHRSLPHWVARAKASLVRAGLTPRRYVAANRSRDPEYRALMSRKTPFTLPCWASQCNDVHLGGHGGQADPGRHPRALMRWGLQCRLTVRAQDRNAVEKAIGRDQSGQPTSPTQVLYPLRSRDLHALCHARNCSAI